ncbi:MAG: DNA cytosine methyltransferase [Thermoguttaceae bacterium]|nr:DNA cytosine methyltransferase [Thermoguttaceae bacterium]
MPTQPQTGEAAAEKFRRVAVRASSTSRLKNSASGNPARRAFSSNVAFNSAETLKFTATTFLRPVERRPVSPSTWPPSPTRFARRFRGRLQNYRWTTAPEAGAALGFPDDFIYVGAGSDAYRGIGGSVSVDATEAILTKLFGEVF